MELCIPGSKTRACGPVRRPCCFATYIAMSALRSSSRPLVTTPAAGGVAIPTLARIVMVLPASSKGSASTVISRWASSHACASSAGSSNRTANSSPPSRAAVSLARISPTSRAATSRRSSSPASCPSESLTSLNSSRSRKSTARPGATSRRASACSSRSRNRSRLARPVRPSWKAWCRRDSSSRRCSVTSRTVSTIPPTASSPRRSRSTTSTSTEEVPHSRSNRPDHDGRSASSRSPVKWVSRWVRKPSRSAGSTKSSNWRPTRSSAASPSTANAAGDADSTTRSGRTTVMRSAALRARALKCRSLLASARCSAAARSASS